MRGIELAEAGSVPDFAIRLGIRHMLRRRLRELEARDAESAQEHLSVFLDELRRGPIALVPDLANQQHYEVSAAFFERVLGPHLKYSGCYWPEGAVLLADAEAAMLELTCARAGLCDGMKVLDLGCGWGSLTLWMARQYPNASITSVSNHRC